MTSTIRTLASFVFLIVVFTVLSANEKGVRDESHIKLTEHDDHLLIETDKLQARISKRGYVSGVSAGSLVDKITGARDLGFGLHIMDFLLAPGWRDDGYSRDAKLHGNLPKHYVEGPQICTQAKQLAPEIIRGPDFLAVRLRFTFTQPGQGYKAGSQWLQTLLFRPGVRYFFSSEEITSANEVDELFYRIDMPGHIRHDKNQPFTKIYLSYNGEIPASEFGKDFGPDERFLYRRRDGQIPARMIRAYQVRIGERSGPWLAGMTLEPGSVSEGWCHQRSYVCLIQENHRRRVKAGETFGAAYLVGWFDSVDEMNAAYDRFKGARSISLAAGKAELQKKQ
jgi:hypothetical protein